MKRWLLLLCMCLALGLVAAGCGDDDDDSGDSGATTEEPAKEPATGGGGGGGATVAVDMVDIEFVPKDVTVKKGGTIKWTNSDSVTHTVTKEDGPGADFDSGNVEGGGEFEQKFDAPGKINYVCRIHPNQTGTITVE